MSVRDSGWGDLPAPTSKLSFLGSDAMEKPIADYEFTTVLDVGCGAGLHAEFLRSRGKNVTTIDAGHYHEHAPDHLGLYEK